MKLFDLFSIHIKLLFKEDTCIFLNFRITLSFWNLFCLFSLLNKLASIAFEQEYFGLLLLYVLKLNYGWTLYTSSMLLFLKIIINTCLVSRFERFGAKLENTSYGPISSNYYRKFCMRPFIPCDESIYNLFFLSITLRL